MLSLSTLFICLASRFSEFFRSISWFYLTPWCSLTDSTACSQTAWPSKLGTEPKEDDSLFLLDTTNVSLETVTISVEFPSLQDRPGNVTSASRNFQYCIVSSGCLQHQKTLLRSCWWKAFLSLAASREGAELGGGKVEGSGQGGNSVNREDLSPCGLTWGPSWEEQVLPYPREGSGSCLSIYSGGGAPLGTEAPKDRAAKAYSSVDSLA